MKKFVCIFLFLVFLSPDVSFGLTEVDTCPPIFMKVSDIKYKYDADISESDSIELCMFLYPLSSEKYDSFCTELENEGVNIFWSEQLEESNNTVISIRLTKAQFTSLFDGRIEYKQVAASSHSGYISQIFVDSYIIPEKFKKIIELITSPDPQTGGC